MPFNCIFQCGYFDNYHSGLARSVLFFVTVYIVKISTVLCSVGHGKYIYHHWLGIFGTCFARNTISLRANVSTYTLGECILYVFAPYIALYLDCIRYVRYYVNSNLYHYSRNTLLLDGTLHIANVNQGNETRPDNHRVMCILVRMKTF